MTGRTDLITMIDGCRRGEGGGDHRAGQSHGQRRRRRGELRRRRWSEGDGSGESTGWWCCYCYWGGQRSLLAKYYYYYHDTQPDFWLYILSRNLYLSLFYLILFCKWNERQYVLTKHPKMEKLRLKSFSNILILPPTSPKPPFPPPPFSAFGRI